MKKFTKLERYLDSVMAETNLPAGQKSVILLSGDYDEEGGGFNLICSNKNCGCTNNEVSKCSGENSDCTNSLGTCNGSINAGSCKTDTVNESPEACSGGNTHL